jgi:hypothetical protein
MRPAYPALAFALAAMLTAGTLLISGCSTTSGLINAPPTPKTQHPINVTLHRVDSIAGAVVPMVIVIDGKEIYGLGNGETYRFQLDPGQYVLGWRLGLNTCNQVIFLKNKRDVTINLSNECNIPPEP